MPPMASRSPGRPRCARAASSDHRDPGGADRGRPPDRAVGRGRSVVQWPRFQTVTPPKPPPSRRASHPQSEGRQGASHVRPHRVVAGAALIALLASVAVAGSAGSRSPTPAASIDPNAFSAVRLDGSSATEGTTTPTLDPANGAAAGIEPGVEMPEPPFPMATGVPPDLIVVPSPGLVIQRAGTGNGFTISGGWHHNPDESWYGPGFYGQHTACGQILTTTLRGVANRTLPCGTLVTFRNPANGRTATVPVVDRGPYVAGRTWDLTGGLCVYLAHCYTGPIQWRLAGSG